MTRWPPGFASAGISCGIKSSGAPDLGLLVADSPVAWSGTFTLNAAAAAPVVWSRDRLDRPVRAVVVNSGNANACTGPQGEHAVRRTAEAAAAALDCPVDQILVASTGPIGVPLPVEMITGALPAAAGGLTPEVDDFASAIMTTDTHPKVAVAAAGDAKVVGVAKGAAMLAPNMATMLAFIATDALLPEPDLLGAYVRISVRDSFNLISIDACESTNDSVFVLSSGLTPATSGAFSAALIEVGQNLARQMVGDAEGATRVMRIRVSGTVDAATAASLGRSIAGSDLWRAALHGGDPNWGRVLAAMGAEKRDLDLAAISLSIGPVTVFERGAPTGRTADAAAAMTADEVVIDVVVGSGAGTAEVLGCDLSPEYVLENATGSS